MSKKESLHESVCERERERERELEMGEGDSMSEKWC